MSDLDFSKHVDEIPAGEQLPEYQRRESPEVTPTPDLQGAVSNYADSSNWLSAIGSKVAQSAATARATQMGIEEGKHPHGDLGVPLTDFDRTMAESYKQQSNATLGLQADQLITDSNIEMAKASRITPDLIAKTNKSISQGLQNIFKQAPAEIQPELSSRFGQMQMNQASGLTERMIREQKEDTKNNSNYATQMNSEQAYSLGLAGNDKAAQAVIDSDQKLNDSNVASNIYDKLTAKSNTDSTRQSYLSGKMIHDYQAAQQAGKGEEYLKSISDKKPGYLSDADYRPVTNNLLSYVQRQDSLKSQAQQLKLANFSVDLAKNPNDPAMASKLQDIKNNFPSEYPKAQLEYIKAIKSFNSKQQSTNLALSGWKDPAAFARLPDKAKDQAFDQLVTSYQQKQQDAGEPVTQDQAEVVVAASAGGKVPYFQNTIINKLHSGNPDMMDSAVQQMHDIYEMGSAQHALSGLSDNDKALYGQYEALRSSLPADEAAKIAIQNSNQPPDIQKMNQAKWAAVVKQAGSGMFGSAPTDWALAQVGMSKDDFSNPGLSNVYGNMILQKYGAYFQMTNGDQATARKLATQDVNQNFGYTGVNGSKTKTLHPIEKTLGYDENSGVVPFIQQDAMSQLSQNFASMKDDFDKKNSNVYWEAVPTDMKNHAMLYGHDFSPMQVKRFTRTASGIKTDNYNVNLVGNSFNWDVVLQTDSGMRPLSQVAPYLGIQTYTPNKEAIDRNYLASQSNTPPTNPLIPGGSNTGINVNSNNKPASTMDQEGENFIKDNETNVKGKADLTSYKDDAGNWTIGYGHNLGQDSKYANTTITQKQADDLYSKDSTENINAVKSVLTRQVPQKIFNMLVDFSYQYGPDRLKDTGLLKAVNSGDYNKIPEELRKWKYITVNGNRVEATGIKNRQEKRIKYIGMK